ncbi:hypothetical protein FM037_27580 [Shewanella psychropiezotolerans]|uniref:YscD cytoplasmic domain-containing protein n=1 Tax=Shewanella psychropiezotolerans TaxID=2593655 RepID=A0ABX5X4Y8_9GAMM|nr:FHA domain-containing protein [Shewanella psychropiezotolerans]QDO86339.1 hypothetical protein FM037_27580 [Shewanella psychropiezotolerans]
MTQWKIKLLSGSHAQVELPLSAGEFIIGSDELNADIVLSDKDIDAKHVTLSVAEAITLIELPQASQIFINDEQKQTHSSLILARGTRSDSVPYVLWLVGRKMNWGKPQFLKQVRLSIR